MIECANCGIPLNRCEGCNIIFEEADDIMCVDTGTDYVHYHETCYGHDEEDEEVEVDDSEAVSSDLYIEELEGII